MKGNLDLNSDALALRKSFGEDASSPIDIFSLVACRQELTLVLYPLSSLVSGMCLKSTDAKIIMINSAMTKGRQRFTIAHELYHLYFQDEVGKFVCSMDINTSKNSIEREADIFASYFLAPHESLRGFIANLKSNGKTKLEMEDVLRIEQYYQISHAATLTRLIEEGYLTIQEAETMKSNVCYSASLLGFDTALYEKTNAERAKFTWGRYVWLAEKLYKEEKISEGKYRELLNQAFRNDLFMDGVMTVNEDYD